MTAVVRKLKIKKEQGINSNFRQFQSSLYPQDTSTVPKINNHLTGSVANSTSTRTVTKDDYLLEL